VLTGNAGSDAMDAMVEDFRHPGIPMMDDVG
jgi:hypothetical protein